MCDETEKGANLLSNVIRVLRTEYATDAAGRYWKRKVTGDDSRSKWKPAPSKLQAEKTPSDKILLYLVQREQLDSDVYHWLLFAAKEGQKGTVYQVSGDTTMMHHLHEMDTDAMVSETYQRVYEVGDLDKAGVKRLEFYANNEPPPKAENIASIKENCQAWSVRVLRRLQEEGLVAKRWVEFAESEIEDLRNA